MYTNELGERAELLSYCKTSELARRLLLLLPSFPSFVQIRPYNRILSKGQRQGDSKTHQSLQTPTSSVIHSDPHLGSFHPATKVPRHVALLCIPVSRHALKHAHLSLNVCCVVILSVEVDDLESDDEGGGDVESFVDRSESSFTDLFDSLRTMRRVERV